MKIFTQLFITLIVIGLLTLWFLKDPAERETEREAERETEQFIETQTIDTQDKNWRTQLTMPPKLTFAKDTKYYWLLETNLGDMKFELLHETAPMHVSSTIYLTKLGFYDSLTFHRVISGFMAQGGDPLGSGRGNPGYRYGGEFDPLVSHSEKGMLSMANSGPNTDGSQFFITFRATPHLDGRHTVFGQLVSGEPVLDLFNTNGTRFGTPKQPLIIEKAHILIE
jgi:cyclophilin family peptidyl-prolyl cis-trans isomerase